MERINSRKLRNELIVQWFDKNENINESDKKLLYDLATDYCGGDIRFLYEMNEMLYSDYKELCYDNKTGLIYRKEKDKHLLSYKEETKELSYLQCKEIVTAMIDMLEKIYPIGDMGSGKHIHFTSALIETVLQEGFSDEREETYIYFMKREAIIEKGMHSFGFATEEESRLLKKKMGGES